MMYDVVVVGAGSGGCGAAYTVATKGFKVCLIDVKPRDEIGNKICGNAVGYHHLENIGLAPPKDCETNPIEGLIIYSPSLHSLRIPGGEYMGGMIDRWRFGQHLLDQSVDEGVDLMDKTRVVGPIIENDYVTGVEVVPSESIRAKIVIDTSGLKSPIRSKLAEFLGTETGVKNTDINLAYREIRRVKKPFEPGDENYCKLYLDPERYPGGYGWVFPQSEDMANVGLGVQKVEGHPNLRERLYETLLREELFRGSEIVEMHGFKQMGGMEVSTRRSLPSLVWNGFLIAGEAGLIMDPVTAAGHGQAIVTGEFAGRAACGALERGDMSMNSLWGYNLMHYAKDGLGPKYTSLDAFRIYLQHSTPENIDFAIEHGILEAADLLNLTTKGRLNFSNDLKKVFRGRTNMPLLKELHRVRKVMKEISKHCMDFPQSYEGFPEWRKRTEQIFSGLEEEFIPYSTRCRPGSL